MRGGECERGDADAKGTKRGALEDADGHCEGEVYLLRVARDGLLQTLLLELQLLPQGDLPCGAVGAQLLELGVVLADRLLDLGGHLVLHLHDVLRLPLRLVHHEGVVRVPELLGNVALGGLGVGAWRMGLWGMPTSHNPQSRMMWDGGCGMWYVVCGMWYVVCGMWDVWDVVCGMWYVGCGMWYVVCGMWYVVCGMWYVVCGMWYVVCGMWYVVCGMWDVGCGMWDVVCVGCGMCRMWYVVCGMW